MTTCPPDECHDAGRPGCYFGTAITASRVDALTLSVPAGPITASTVSRTLGGPVVRYGVYGRTSAGRLRVRAGALRWPDDLTRVKLTEEHDRSKSRGYLTSVHEVGDVVRVAARVSDGPLGDAALLEAADHTRDGFSFDVIDATIEGDEITDALVIAIGQVGIPAYDDMRIDTIAAAAAAGTGTPPTTPAGDPAGDPLTDPTDPDSGSRDTEGTDMTPDQVARLNELRARNESELTDAERTELALLVQLEAATSTGTAAAADGAATAAAAGTPVAASIPAVPTGTPRAATRTAPRAGALQSFYDTIVTALRPGGGGAAAITAALSDITHDGAGASIEAPAWSGELWSGLEYEPEFTPLLSSGDLTSWEGAGWRFVTKPQMQDYAGNKAAIPSGPVTTEPSSYEAQRKAVGHDIDRKFYDFPNQGFLQAYAEACRESWAIELDAEVEAYIAAHAVPVTTVDGPDVGTDPDLVTSDSLLKAVAIGARALKRGKVGRPTFVIVNGDDMLDLFDVTNDQAPAFLSLFNIDPSNWTSSDQVAPGTVTVGVRQAATVRTLPGSPLRVDAQHIANGGVDTGFFGYWAIEEHHTSGIVSVAYDIGA